MKISAIPVQRKNTRRLTRRAPRYMPAPIRAAIPRPTTAPTSTQVAPVCADAACPTRNRAVSRPSRITATKARTAKPVRRAVSERPTERRVELVLDRRRGAPHPEQHPGDHPCREQHRDGLEQLLVRRRQLADGDEQRNAGRQADRDRRPDAQPDPPEGLPVPRPVEVGEDDPDDQRGLDALAEAGEQAGGEGPEVQGWLPWDAVSRAGGALVGGARWAECYGASAHRQATLISYHRTA